jgi:hypothetical protein
MSLILDGTNGLSDVDGSAATPAIRGSDANTGVFFGSDVVGLSTGGTERVRVDASGNVGIGTSSPAVELDVVGIAQISSDIQSSGNPIIYSYNGASAGTVNAGIQLVGSDPSIRFSTNNTERARIDSSGNLLVGTTSVPAGGQKMNIAGGITPTADNSFIFGNSGLRWQALYAANGTIQTSDERDKTEIVDAPLGLAFINALRPVAYKFKVGKNDVLADGSVVPVAGVRQHFGLLAQDVKHAAGAVDFGGWILTDTADAESPQGLRYDEFISPLIKAIQEQQAIITALTARVEALEGAQA